VTGPALEPSRALRELSARCGGCGADLPLDPERRVVRCAHCGAANLAVGRIVRPVARLRPRLGREDLAAAVGRLARRRDLESVPAVTGAEEIWIPYWASGAGGADAPARAAIDADDPQLGELSLPGGELEPLEPAEVEADVRWRWPTVPPVEGEVLRYVPFFRVRLAAGGREVLAWVERVDGHVRTSSPLNPRRLRFTGALGALVATYAAAGLALGVLAPNPWIALGGLAASALALGWPAKRLAVRTEAGAGGPAEGDT